MNISSVFRVMMLSIMTFLVTNPSWCQQARPISLIKVKSSQAHLSVQLSTLERQMYGLLSNTISANALAIQKEELSACVESIQREIRKTPESPTLKLTAKPALRRGKDSLLLQSEALDQLAQRATVLRKIIDQIAMIKLNASAQNSTSISNLRKSTLTGTVRNAQGTPIPNVDVVLLQDKEDTSVIAIQKTDAAGKYLFTNLNQGIYYTYYHDVTETYEPKYYINTHFSQFQFADDITLTANGSFQADISLDRSGSIRGRVTNASGQGISKVVVCVADTNWWAYTNTDGTYEIPHVFGGNYFLKFDTQEAQGFVAEWYNNQPNSDNAEMVGVTSGQPTNDINAVLDPAGFVSGRVTNASGIGISNVKVWALVVDTGTQISSALTNANGEYRIGTLPAGGVKIQFATDGLQYYPKYYNNQSDLDGAEVVSVVVGKTTPKINTKLVLGSRIGGFVKGPNGEIPQEIFVKLYDLEQNLITEMYAEKGRFDLMPIPAGSYKVYFSTMGYGGWSSDFVTSWYNGKKSFETAQVVKVGQSGSTEITGTLQRAGYIACHVLPEEKFIKVIQVVNENNEPIVSTPLRGTRSSYTLGGIPQGNCKLVVYSFDPKYLNQWYFGKDAFETATVIPVVAGSTSKAEVHLQMTGSVKGRVIDPENGGVGVPNIRVVVYNNKQEEVAGGYTNENGEYHVYGLTTGVYRINYNTDQNSNYITKWYPNQYDYRQAHLIHVDMGQTTNLIDMQLRIDADDIVTVTKSGVWLRKTETKQCQKLTSQVPTCITGADIDQDGTFDLVGFWDGVLKVRLYNDVWQTVIENTSTVQGIAVAQMNDDNQPDYIISSKDGVCWMDSVTGEKTTLSKNMATFISWGDFDADGLMDVVAYWPTGQLRIWHGSTKIWEDIPQSLPVLALAVGDINGDGIDDLIISNMNGISYRNSTTQQWITVGYRPAVSLAAGYFDYNRRQSIVAVFNQGLSSDLWIRWGHSGSWEYLDRGDFLTVTSGKMR